MLGEITFEELSSLPKAVLEGRINRLWKERTAEGTSEDRMSALDTSIAATRNVLQTKHHEDLVGKAIVGDKKSNKELANKYYHMSVTELKIVYEQHINAQRELMFHFLNTADNVKEDSGDAEDWDKKVADDVNLTVAQVFKSIAEVSVTLEGEEVTLKEGMEQYWDSLDRDYAILPGGTIEFYD